MDLHFKIHFYFEYLNKFFFWWFILWVWSEEEYEDEISVIFFPYENPAAIKCVAKEETASRGRQGSVAEQPDAELG